MTVDDITEINAGGIRSSRVRNIQGVSDRVAGVLFVGEGNVIGERGGDAYSQGSSVDPRVECMIHLLTQVVLTSYHL
jgi:hypothetical protein